MRRAGFTPLWCGIESRPPHRTKALQQTGRPAAPQKEANSMDHLNGSQFHARTRDAKQNLLQRLSQHVEFQPVRVIGPLDCKFLDQVHFEFMILEGRIEIPGKNP
jgi:hypothetical protein